jgi:deoxycytidylate deaminase
MAAPRCTGCDRHTKIINLLAKVATDIPVPVRTNSRLAAAVVYRGDIVAFGTNEMKTHPFQAKYAKNDMAVFLHAETSAIKNSLREISIDELEASSLYVVRIKSTPSHKTVFGLSRPCSGCQRCIEAFGLRKVYYTLDSGQYQTL